VIDQRLHGPEDECPACYDCPGCIDVGPVNPVVVHRPGYVAIVCGDCDGTGVTCPNFRSEL
jgi:hypothetical protein